MEVAHNDGDPSNNRLSNLRYDTRAGNAADTFRHGTAVRGETHGMVKLTPAQVLDIRSKSAEGLTTPQLLALFPVKETQLYRILRRESWKHI
jgi:HNH endonuclease